MIFEKNEGELLSFGITTRVSTVILLVRKVTETLTLQKTGEGRIFHTVEQFLLAKERTSSPVLYSPWFYRLDFL